MPFITCPRSFLSNLCKFVFISTVFVFLCTPAWASTIEISYSPTPVEVSVGDQWDLDIYLTGQLEEGMSLNYMNIRFSFDKDVISFSSASFGTWAESCGSTDYDTYTYGEDNDIGIILKVTNTASGFTFEELEDELFATVSFNAIGIGTSSFDPIGSVYIYEESSGTFVIEETNSAEITVSEAASVPEPTTMILLASGLVGLVGFRRKF